MVTRLVEENISLKKKIDRHEAAMLLESKTKDMKPSMANYLKGLFEGKSCRQVSDEFDNVAQAFLEDENDSRESAARKASATKVSVPSVITESNESEKPDNSDTMIDTYVSSMRKSLSARK
jgi:hypothetical protein